MMPIGRTCRIRNARRTGWISLSSPFIRSCSLSRFVWYLPMVNRSGLMSLKYTVRKRRVCRFLLLQVKLQELSRNLWKRKCRWRWLKKLLVSPWNMWLTIKDIIYPEVMFPVGLNTLMWTVCAYGLLWTIIFPSPLCSMIKSFLHWRLLSPVRMSCETIRSIIVSFNGKLFWRSVGKHIFLPIPWYSNTRWKNWNAWISMLFFR